MFVILQHYIFITLQCYVFITMQLYYVWYISALLCSTHCDIWKLLSNCDVGISASQWKIRKCSSHCNDKMMCDTMWWHAYPHPYMFDTLPRLEMFVTLWCLYIFITLRRLEVFVTMWRQDITSHCIERKCSSYCNERAMWDT